MLGSVYCNSLGWFSFYVNQSKCNTATLWHIKNNMSCSRKNIQKIGLIILILPCFLLFFFFFNFYCTYYDESSCFYNKANSNHIRTNNYCSFYNFYSYTCFMRTRIQRVYGYFITYRHPKGFFLNYLNLLFFFFHFDTILLYTK